jgi:hypothetical protein
MLGEIAATTTSHMNEGKDELNSNKTLNHVGQWYRTNREGHQAPQPHTLPS